MTLIGAESEPPYQRPPLSKAYLEGALEKSRLYLKPLEFYEKQAIGLRLGVRVGAIARDRKEIRLESGETLAYDKLLIATGSAPRRLKIPGADLDGVFYLRSMADSDGLGPVLNAGRPLVIIGAGYIGLEVAAVARKRGLAVIVLEALDRPLARVAGPQVSAFYENLHRTHGVDLRLGALVEGFAGSKAIDAVVLKGGEMIPCGAVLIGIGAAPATELAEAAGIKVDNGIVVDDHARSEDAAIWAAGDCTNFPSPLYGRRIRLESAPNAIEQAKAAAANMAGGDVVYGAVPWFWSDQYDVKLQSAGLADGADQRVVRGQSGGNSLAVWSLKAGRLLAVDTMNDPGAFMIGKKLIAAKAAPDPKVLADPAGDLKSLLS